MDLLEAMKNRHSVRQYKDTPIDEAALRALRSEIDACNKAGDLHIQLVTNEEKAFDCFMAHYGKFEGVRNYIALVGKKDKTLDERCGYYGERLVLEAQRLGLNTCWVAMSYRKVNGAFEIKKGEKCLLVIAIGYGKNSGVAHKSKPVEAVASLTPDSPEWFRSGVEAALLAPTAMNEQKFSFACADGKVTAKAGAGLYTKVDLGIAKYHFELGAGKENFAWQS